MEDSAMKRFVTFKLVISAILVLTVPLTVFSRGPNLINYQASVTDNLGEPIADGPHDFIFGIYFHPTNDPALWSESVTINTVDGSFSHLIGSVDPEGNQLPTDLFVSGDSLWLEITIDGEAISPRTRLVSVGNALAVQTIDGANGGAVYGDVTVPAGKLHVESQENLAGYFTSDYNSYEATVLKAEYTGTASGWGDSMLTAVVGISNPADAAGIGGSFIGGYKGVEGSVWQTGNDEYYGVSGFVHADDGYGTKYGVKGQVVTWGSGSSGYHHGVLGDAYGGLVSYGIKGIAMAADTNYGVFGQVFGSGVNYAGYFTSDHYSPNSTVLKAEYTGTAGGWGDSMITAVVGISNPADASGIGGSFVGGYKGVEGSVWQTGNDEYYGVSGFVAAGDGYGTEYGVKGQVVTWGSGSSGRHYGVLGDAYGGLVSYGVKGIAMAADTNYGVFGQVYSSGVNYAGYFKGDVHSTGTISCTLSDDNFMPGLRGLDVTVTNTDAGAMGGKFRVEADGIGEHYGLHAEAVGATGSDSSAFGLYAQANTSNTYQSAHGVYGYSYAVGDAADAYGGLFDGVTTNASGGAYGCVGNAWNNSTGTVYGGYFYAGGNSGAGTHYGVYAGVSGSGTNYAGYFDGDVHIAGTLTGGKNGIKIDHPLDPDNKILYHSSVESPDMMNIYNGNVILDGDGEAVVSLPGYFEALNMDFRYQLTCLGSFAPVYIAREISDNRFVIAGGEPGMKISWQVTGIRKDAAAEADRTPVEEVKSPEEKGKYLDPEAFGFGKDMGADYNPDLETALPDKNMLTR